MASVLHLTLRFSETSKTFEDNQKIVFKKCCTREEDKMREKKTIGRRRLSDAQCERERLRARENKQNTVSVTNNE